MIRSYVGRARASASRIVAPHSSRPLLRFDPGDRAGIGAEARTGDIAGPRMFVQEVNLDRTRKRRGGREKGSEEEKDEEDEEEAEGAEIKEVETASWVK